MSDQPFLQKDKNSRPITRRDLAKIAAVPLLAQVAWPQGRGGRGGVATGVAAPAGTAASGIPDTEWHSFAHDLASTRYVPLDQINATNFSKLEPAWQFRTDNLGSNPETNNQCTPILAKGRLYCTAGARRDVVALDAATGEQLWMYRHPEGSRGGPRTGSGHGVSYWTDGNEERVIYVTPGYQLISLDAKTGVKDPAFGKGGVVDLREDDDQTMDLITADIGLHSTPLIAKSVVVVGAAHADGLTPRGRNNVKGYTRGFDVKSGKRLWVFHTIPLKGEFGYDTWITEGQAEMTGNTGVWAQMSADEELGLVYVGVEMPTSDYVGIYRRGNGLFGESIVALDLQTGKRKWHFQMVHHGLWDRDPPCASILCDLQINGRTIKALAQPSKQCFLYVLNRETGEPVWPINETPVPKGDVPGEWYSPTQPVPSKPPAYDVQGIGPDDLVNFTPEIKARALEIIKHWKTGEMFTPPVVSDPNGLWGTLTVPGLTGGTNWPGGAYDPETRTVYVYSKTVVNMTAVGPNPNKESDAETIGARINAGGGRGGRGGAPQDVALTGPVPYGTTTVAGLPLLKPPYGRITAIDMNKGEFSWQVVHGETTDDIRNHPLLKGLNIPRTGQAGVVGPLVTKSLVICGDPLAFTDGTGRHGARLRAYDKASGAEKGELFLPGPETGVPMSYMLGGRQYIVLSVGMPGGGSSFLAFRLPNNG